MAKPLPLPDGEYGPKRKAVYPAAHEVHEAELYEVPMTPTKYGKAYNYDIPLKRRNKATGGKGVRTRYSFERSLTQYDPRYVKRNNNGGRSQIPSVLRGVCDLLPNVNTVTSNIRDQYDNKSMDK